MSTAVVVSGKELAKASEQLLTQRVELFKEKSGKIPGLGVILVGDNPASKVYVANKEKAAARVGFKSIDRRLPNEASASDVFEAIQQLNQNKEVDGILLQLPLPKGLPSDELISAILPTKDADGLHPFNQGLMMRGDGLILPCTPAGSLRLIDLSYHLLAGKKMTAEPLPVDLSGKTAVVIGRSILVGKPMALMLQARNATVTMAHSRTNDLRAVCATADILVVAVGVKELVRGDFIKPGAIVIDVGMNRGDDGKLYGDVAFDEAHDRAAALTPVPGGVGPMTIQMLLENTFQAALSANA